MVVRKRLSLSEENGSRLRKAFAAAAWLIVLSFSGGSARCAPPVGDQVLQYTGVNLAGGEFSAGHSGTPVYGKDFIYPDDSEFLYFFSYLL